MLNWFPISEIQDRKCQEVYYYYFNGMAGCPMLSGARRPDRSARNGCCSSCPTQFQANSPPNCCDHAGGMINLKLLKRRGYRPSPAREKGLGDVLASGAKQSRASVCAALDCFVAALLAMTKESVVPHPLGVSLSNSASGREAHFDKLSANGWQLAKLCADYSLRERCCRTATIPTPPLKRRGEWMRNPRPAKRPSRGSWFRARPSAASRC